MKTRRRKTTKLKRRKETTAARHRSLAANLQKQLGQRTRELTEARKQLAEAQEQQTATSDVLQVISSLPGELEPVFQAILARATRTCEAKFGLLYRIKSGSARIISKFGIPSTLAEYMQRGPHRPSLNRPGSLTPIMRVIQSCQTLHIADYRKDQAYLDRDPLTVAGIELGGIRTLLLVPMIKNDELMGAIVIFRQEVRPFTDKQIALVQNFAAQAVVAIENTRLLNELRESLQQQTATAEVLKVISSSPGDLQPVFQAMLANATRICEASFGNLLLYENGLLRRVALHNTPSAYNQFNERNPFLDPDKVPSLGRLVRTLRVVQVVDLAVEEPDSPIAYLGGARTLLVVPMIKDNVLIGGIGIYRKEVRPFTDKQIELVQNFAAQAVIAIENARLLNELRESLQQQTATSEVLGVISSSPGELEPVFLAVLENATRICQAKFGLLYICEGEEFRAAAFYNAPAGFVEQRRRGPVRPRPDTALGRVATTRAKLLLAPG
jgi:GAF domain-containing protein